MSTSIKIISYLVLIVVAICCSTPTTNASILESCAKDALANVGQVSLTGCDFEKDSICNLIRGSDASISVDLTPSDEIKDAKVVVGAKIGSLYLPFALKQDDACLAYGLKCPMEKGSQQKVTISLPIKPQYPSLPNMKVQFKLVDASNKDIFCVTFPAKIVNK